MRILVIGGNAAGLSAASRARRLDRHAEITVLEKSETISYAACGLPYYLDSRVRQLQELTTYTPEQFETNRRIRIRTRTEVTAISHPRREVVLAGGEKLPYDALVLATGARPRHLDLGRDGGPPLFSLHTFADAERLKACLRDLSPRTAAVIGAGYIGLEMAEVLRANGLKVTVFEAGSSLLGLRDQTLIEALAARFERFGVELRLGEPAGSIGRHGVNGVPADLIINGTGFRPNVELAEEAGIEIGRTGAIRVSEFLETNLHGVYAAGDCAEAVHRVTGRPSYIPLGTTANKMGRVAGANAAGRRVRFRGVMGTLIVRTCGLGIGITGLTSSQAKAEGFDAVSDTVSALDRPRYFWGTRLTVELVAERRSGRILGALVIGEQGVRDRVNVVATALEQRLTAEEIEFLDLAYAPPFSTVADPLQIAARQLRKLLH